MKLLVSNKKASYDYIFLDKVEAGIILNGDEVKSVLNHNVNFANSYIKIIDNVPELINCHIGYYKFAKHLTKDQVEKYTYRSRKLLLNKSQIDKLSLKLQKDNLTIIPVSFYLNDHGKIKLEIALSKGKKEYDKREKIKTEELKRETQRLLKYN